jgi:hypothetical protein
MYHLLVPEEWPTMGFAMTSADLDGNGCRRPASSLVGGFGGDHRAP